MNYDFTGKLIEKFAEQRVSDRFTKREFVLEVTEGTFAEQVKFQLTQDKTILLDPFELGDSIKVSFNIRGSKWKDNYFVNLQAWKLERSAPGAASQSPQSGSSARNMPAAPPSNLPPVSAEDAPPF